MKKKNKSMLRIIKERPKEESYPALEFRVQKTWRLLMHKASYVLSEPNTLVRGGISVFFSDTDVQVISCGKTISDGETQRHSSFAFAFAFT